MSREVALNYCDIACWINEKAISQFTDWYPIGIKAFLGTGLQQTNKQTNKARSTPHSNPFRCKNRLFAASKSPTPHSIIPHALSVSIDFDAFSVSTFVFSTSRSVSIFSPLLL